MSVHFRSIKHKTTYNISLKMATEYSTPTHPVADYALDRYHVGDRFEIMMNVPTETATLIKENCADKQVEIKGAYTDGGSAVIFIPFVVVERRHCVSALGPLHLVPQAVDITVEATSWGWEDVFRLLFLVERPSWFPENN